MKILKLNRILCFSYGNQRIKQTFLQKREIICLWREIPLFKKLRCGGPN
uniref:Uncharacterized protein n=1 Tax=Arundo donax TaxID=35708 RepID=A0A0A9E583_ARUDO